MGKKEKNARVHSDGEGERTTKKKREYRSKRDMIVLFQPSSDVRTKVFFSSGICSGMELLITTLPLQLLGNILRKIIVW
jgi:hypothetical protein